VTVLWGISSHFYPQELLEDGRRNKKKGKRKERERLRVGKRRRKKKRKSFFLRRYLGGGWPEKERWAGIKEMATERARGGLIPELLHTVRLNARKRASAARRCIIRQRASSRTAHLSPPDNQRRKKEKKKL
jgi:hypothetical protein